MPGGYAVGSKDLRQYLQMQEELERVSRELERARGHLEAVDASLLADFDCTPQQAQTLLAQLEKQADAKEDKADQLWQAWQKQWQEKLEE